MKIQVKDVYEGPKNNKVFLGTLYVESCKGRLDQVLSSLIDDKDLIQKIHEAYKTTLIESLVDTQVLHHQATTAFKAKASKNNAATGIDRLPWEAQPNRVLYRRPWASVDVELDENQTLPEDPDEVDIVHINWGFQPGQSAAAMKKAEEAAEKQRRFEQGVAHQVALMKEFTGAEPTAEQMEKIRALVHNTVYGTK